jgi:hypothetical protein
MIETNPQTGEQTWTTAHGDTVTVWQAAPPGRLLNWRWHVHAANGEIVGQGQGHTRRRNARAAAMRHHPPVGGPPSRYLIARLADLLEHEDRINLSYTAIPEVAATLAAQIVEEISTPVNPDRTAVELPRAWLAVPDSIPMPGQRVLLDGVPHAVYGLETDPDRAVVRLARVTTTSED